MIMTEEEIKLLRASRSDKEWEGELGRTIMLAGHSLLLERKVYLKEVAKLKGENKRLRKELKKLQREMNLAMGIVNRRT